MTESNVMGSISIERLHSIEREREEVVGSTEFQQWMRELNVGRLYTDPTGSLNGRDMMREWDWSRMKDLQM